MAVERLVCEREPAVRMEDVIINTQLCRFLPTSARDRLRQVFDAKTLQALQGDLPPQVQHRDGVRLQDLSLQVSATIVSYFVDLTLDARQPGVTGSLPLEYQPGIMEQMSVLTKKFTDIAFEVRAYVNQDDAVDAQIAGGALTKLENFELVLIGPVVDSSGLKTMDPSDQNYVRSHSLACRVLVAYILSTARSGRFDVSPPAATLRSHSRLHREVHHHGICALRRTRQCRISFRQVEGVLCFVLGEALGVIEQARHQRRNGARVQRIQHQGNFIFPAPQVRNQGADGEVQRLARRVGCYSH